LGGTSITKLRVAGAAESVVAEAGARGRSGGGRSSAAAGVGRTNKERAEAKEKGDVSGQAVGRTVRWRKPSDRSSVAVAKGAVSGEAAAKAEAAAEDEGRPEVLAWLREAAAGSNKQPGGRPKLAAARVIGKS